LRRPVESKLSGPKIERNHRIKNVAKNKKRPGFVMNHGTPEQPSPRTAHGYNMQFDES
jgi:hypothetical protein